MELSYILNFNENGNWTTRGYEAYGKLTQLLYSLHDVTVLVNAYDLIDELDKIEWITD